jgi:hypothetical protein
MAGTQIRRKICGGVNQFPKVNHAFDLCFCRGCGEIARYVQVTIGVDLSTLFSMDQVIGN